MNQKEETIMKRSNTAKFTLGAAMVLALGLAPAVKAADQGCTNSSLKGTFSHMGTGFITGTASLSINGNIVSVTETGTYKVNPDCTGTYTVTSQGATTRAFFVIDDSGNEVKAVCTDPGTVITHIFRMQFPAGDWRQ